MPLPETVHSYLNKCSSGRWILDWNRTDGIENVIVIPAISEYENIIGLLHSLSANDKVQLRKTLILFVINNTLQASEAVKKNNRLTLALLRCIIKKDYSVKAASELNYSRMQIGLVDASTEGNEFDILKGGVGLARKTGMDLALTVFDYSIAGKKILISLDADCLVENNYLSAISNAFNKLKLNAATIEFSHRTDSLSDFRAILSYEIFLRYYVAGLLFAKSPFAYHTIGSAFACDYESYIKAGGMNARKAAEDFYFLQKLAKNYSIGKINNTVVRPSARESDRVPFGTGKTVIKFQNGEKQFLLYNPNVFVILKEWLEAFNSDLSLDPDMLLQQTKQIHPELHNFLRTKNFPSQWEKILKNSSSEKQLAYQRRNWFDAFKTLKLIHHLRETAFPATDIMSACEGMLGLLKRPAPDIYEQSEINILKKYLTVLKETETSLSNQKNNETVFNSILQK